MTYVFAILAAITGAIALTSDNPKVIALNGVAFVLNTIAFAIAYGIREPDRQV